jgi:hypothetical protein
LGRLPSATPPEAFMAGLGCTVGVSMSVYLSELDITLFVNPEALEGTYLLMCIRGRSIWWRLLLMNYVISGSIREIRNYLLKLNVFASIIWALEPSSLRWMLRCMLRGK